MTNSIFLLKCRNIGIRHIKINCTYVNLDLFLLFLCTGIISWPFYIFMAILRDNGDGSYSFSYHPVEEGKVNLSVRVEKQEVCGSPFGWNVISNLPGGESSPQRKEYSQTIPTPDSAFFISLAPSVFMEGMYCWKLQLRSFKDDIDSELEIGVTASGYNSGGYGYSTRRKRFERQQQQAKWSWGYSTSTISSQASRSDGQIPSITSVEDNDVFIVFLNLETKKLQ